MLTIMFVSLKTSLEKLTDAEKRKYWLFVFFRAISGGFDIFGILLIGLIAGLISLGNSQSNSIHLLWFDIAGGSNKTILVLALFALLAFTTKAVYAITIIRFTNRFLARVETRLSIDLCRKIFTGGLSSVSSLSKAEIVWALGPAASAAYSGLLSSAAIFIAEGALLGLILIMFLFVDVVATIVVVFFLVFVIFTVQSLIKKKVASAAADSAEGNIASISVIEDLVSAFRELTVMGNMDQYINRFVVTRRRKAIGDSAHNLYVGMPRYIIETALILGVVGFIGFQYFAGSISEGLVVIGVFLTGGVRVMGSLLPMQNAANNIRAQSEHAKHFFEIYELLETDRDISVENTSSLFGTHEDQSLEPLGIDLDKVSFSYPDADRSALVDISVRIDAGSQIAIIGPSGAGKTTLVDLLLGLIEPSSGAISIGGLSPSEIISSFPGKIAYVPQRPGIVAGSIAENVALGVAKNLINEAKVRICLNKVGLLDFVNQLPRGIHSSVGQQLDSLSGGQKQRIGLARALYTDPKLLVLDEATSALDASAEATITSNLSMLRGDVTVIVIAHRLSTIQHCDNVFVLENGSLTNSGTFSYLKQNDSMVTEYVRLMSFDD